MSEVDEKKTEAVEAVEAFDRRYGRHPAMRLPALPGWRAVVAAKAREPRPDGLHDVTIEVLAVAAWNLTTTEREPSRPGPYACGAGGGGIADSLMSFLGVPAPSRVDLAPVCYLVDSERGEVGPRAIEPSDLHRLVAPCDASDQRLLEDAQEWFRQTLVAQQAEQKRVEAIVAAEAAKTAAAKTAEEP